MTGRVKNLTLPRRTVAARFPSAPPAERDDAERIDSFWAWFRKGPAKWSLPKDDFDEEKLVELHEQLVAQGQASSADIMKVLGGIVGGIGFLGAGAILRSQAGVHGLTTAATVWIVAAIGVACGLGLFVLAATSLGLAIVVLLLFGFLERIFFDQGPQDGSEAAQKSEQSANSGKS